MVNLVSYRTIEKVLKTPFSPSVESWSVAHGVSLHTDVQPQTEVSI